MDQRNSETKTVNFHAVLINRFHSNDFFSENVLTVLTIYLKFLENIWHHNDVSLHSSLIELITQYIALAILLLPKAVTGKISKQYTK